MKVTRITVTHLMEAGMPHWDVAKFKIAFPDGCELNPDNYRAAEKMGLSPDAFFSAVCPSSKMLKMWGERFDTYAAEDRLRKELDEKINEMRLAAENTRVQSRCNILIDILSGNNRGDGGEAMT